MAEADFSFRIKETGKWSLEWNGDHLSVGAAWAAMKGIDQTNLEALAIAKAHPLWDNDTHQTQDSLFLKRAELELVGTTAKSTPHVWGSWGVEDRPRWRREEGDQGSIFYPSEKYREQFRITYGTDELADAKVLSTVDVALFLEFGTVKMHARPWLYPAWDATKFKTPENIHRWWKIFESTGRIQGPDGAFMAFKDFLTRVRYTSG